MKKILLILTLVLVLLYTAGCELLSEKAGGDLKDVELAAALSLDKNESGKIEAGVQLLHRDKALEQQYAESYYSLAADGASPAEAVAELYDQGARQLNFSHAALLVLGEEAAGLDNWLDYAVRSPQLRPTLYPVICRGSATDLLDAGEETMSPVYLLENALEPHGSGYPGASAVTLQDFLETLYDDGIAPVLPLAEKTADGIKLAGMAIYDGVEWQFLPESDAAFCWRLLQRPQHLSGEVLTLQEDFSLNIIAAKVFYRLNRAEPPAQPTLQVELTLKAEVVHNPAGLSQMEIERQARERLQYIFAESLDESRRLQLDFLGIGREIKRKLPELWADWQYTDYLNEIAAALNVDMTIEMN